MHNQWKKQIKIQFFILWLFKKKTQYIVLKRILKK